MKTKVVSVMLCVAMTAAMMMGCGSKTAEAAALGFTMSHFVCDVIGVVIAMLVSFIACWIMFGIWAKKGKLDPKELAG